MKRSSKAVNFSKAEAAVSDILLTIEVDYSLSQFEILQILTKYQQRIIKYALKEEWEEAERELRESERRRQADGD